jgi:hypothetical protein
MTEVIATAATCNIYFVTAIASTSAGSVRFQLAPVHLASSPKIGPGKVRASSRAEGPAGCSQMKHKRHSVDQIVSKLRKADVELGKGKKVPEVCKELEVTEQTYYR